MMKALRLAALAAAALAFAPSVRADEVLEAARKEKARREALAKKKGKKPAKEGSAPAVLSNADLKRAGEGPSRLSTISGSAAQPEPAAATGATTAAGATATAGEGKEGKGEAPGEAPRQDDAYWRAKIDEARAAAAAARAEVQELTDRIAVLRREVSALDDPNLQQARRAELTKAEAELPRLQARAGEAERGVDRAREEARRGGASPGALR